MTENPSPPTPRSATGFLLPKASQSDAAVLGQLGQLDNDVLAMCGGLAKEVRQLPVGQIKLPSIPVHSDGRCNRQLLLKLKLFVVVCSAADPMARCSPEGSEKAQAVVI